MLSIKNHFIVFDMAATVLEQKAFEGSEQLTDIGLPHNILDLSKLNAEGPVREAMLLMAQHAHRLFLEHSPLNYASSR